MGLTGSWLAMSLGWLAGMAIAIAVFRGGGWKRQIISRSE